MKLTIDFSNHWEPRREPWYPPEIPRSFIRSVIRGYLSLEKRSEMKRFEEAEELSVKFTWEPEVTLFVEFGITVSSPTNDRDTKFSKNEMLVIQGNALANLRKTLHKEVEETLYFLVKNAWERWENASLDPSSHQMIDSQTFRPV